MKYEILYDSIINKEHHNKGDIITFNQDTDTTYIQRLLNEKVIKAIKEDKEDKPKDNKGKK